MPCPQDLLLLFGSAPSQEEMCKREEMNVVLRHRLVLIQAAHSLCVCVCVCECVCVCVYIEYSDALSHLPQTHSGCLRSRNDHIFKADS